MKKITIAAIIFAIWTSISIANEVNVFSARHYDSDIQLYERFTKKTGIKVNIVSGKDSYVSLPASRINIPEDEIIHGTTRKL